jgi:hypothetical protein
MRHSVEGESSAPWDVVPQLAAVVDAHRFDRVVRGHIEDLETTQGLLKVGYLDHVLATTDKYSLMSNDEHPLQQQGGKCNISREHIIAHTRALQSSTRGHYVTHHFHIAVF